MKSAPESKLFSTNKTLKIRGRLLDLSTPAVMGVLNVTPDSFYDGGRYDNDDALLMQVEKMLEEGATFIDVGAYSSRPGAKDIPPQEELKRAVRAINLALKRFPEAIISIDTFRSDVARAAIQEGASLINDISAGELDARMFRTVADLDVPYVAMHMRGNPGTMNTLTSYQNLLKEITDYFHQKIHTLHLEGIKDIIIDPGFGFAKTIQQNFALLNDLDYLKILGKPIMVGLSRKATIWKTLGVSPETALNGTTVLNTIALLKGISIVRVHDVKEAVETIKLILAMKVKHGQ
ncbi:MAG: dihydropteroate synthase [Cyclobacteriaceae bacterium]|jgi:dihydropteroate synthase|nr:dihydropteroate synthase [Cyclobacteriaceae bacterium]MDH4297414.1 dihydropteroate synthase [Cyclobacteriaceae bacterium]MDH5250337.1 dihydropteroate synthase [Cyclobacteriaceae bacterium]